MSLSAPMGTGMGGCPACVAAPLAQSMAAQGDVRSDIVLSLPGIHCAGCINGVERALHATPGVRAARVNLSRKRVTIEAKDVSPETLVSALANVGYEAQVLDGSLLHAPAADDAAQALLVRLAVAGFAMMNVMLFSVAIWSGAAAATQDLFHWISAGIAVPALLYSAQVFAASAWSALRVGRLNMDVPITLAIILAAASSVFETVNAGEHVYFDAALSLTFFLLVGRYLDQRSRAAARSAAAELSALEAPRALRLQDGIANYVDVADLEVGDKIIVKPGMRAPIDGTVLEGASEIDRSLLTGESAPIAIDVGAVITAGELNLSGPLTVHVSATGQDTTLRRMAAMAEAAESSRNRYTALADRAARIYAPAVHLLALVTFIGWVTLTGDVHRSLNVAISVLIITCPCALGLAVPAVMTAATGRLFRRGLLVKSSTALERLAEADAVVFDKTGTLTTGTAKLDMAALDDTALSLLAALSRASDHPVSRAIAAALPLDLRAADVSDIREYPGKGVEGTWRGQTIRLGHGAWVGSVEPLAFVIGNNAPQPLVMVETLRKGAGAMIEDLRGAGYALSVLSGDNVDATARLSAELGGVPARAGLSPADKQSIIKEMTDDGQKVLMLGDGLNDTGALTQAYVSLAPASALDASRAASDIVLLNSDLAMVPEAIRTAKAARRRVLENFGVAAGYNMIAIPVAVLGFATPLAAAIAMSLSSITVLLNALRVR